MPHAPCATDAGAKLSPAAVERVRNTLHAVALDEDVRRDFERHRLTTEHEAAGLGGVMPTGGAPARRKRDETKRRRDELKAAEAEAADWRRVARTPSATWSWRAKPRRERSGS